MWFVAAGVVGVVAVGLGRLAFQDQGVLWQRWGARWHRHPEANEPSDAAYAGQRVALLVLAVLFAAGAVSLWGSADTVSWSGGEVHDAAEDAASALGSGDPVLAGPVTFDSFLPYLEDALNEADAAEDNAVLLTISRVGAPEDDGEPGPDAPSWQGRDIGEGDEIVEHYTVSAAGEHAVCVTITATSLGPYGPAVGDLPAEQQYALEAAVAGGACPGG